MYSVWSFFRTCSRDATKASRDSALSLFHPLSLSSYASQKRTHSTLSHTLSLIICCSKENIFYSLTLSHTHSSYASQKRTYSALSLSLTHTHHVLLKENIFYSLSHTHTLSHHMLLKREHILLPQQPTLNNRCKCKKRTYSTLN